MLFSIFEISDFVVPTLFASVQISVVVAVWDKMLSLRDAETAESSLAGSDLRDSLGFGT